MIKIPWFSEEMQNEYASEITKKIIDDLQKNINNLPQDIADLFSTIDLSSTKRIVDEEKTKKFLKYKYSDIEKIDELNDYIKRRSLLLKCLDTISKSSFDNWIANNPNSKIVDYLDDRFTEYSTEYPNNNLTYPPGAQNATWGSGLKKEIRKAVLSEPYGSIFVYGKIGDKLRHKLMDSLNVPVCPYCNRQYITSWEDVENAAPDPCHIKSTADLDHFFPKSDYPLFALSLFNFVPSCQVCNSRMKLYRFLDSEGNRPVYPYDESFGDNAVFKATTKNNTFDPEKLLEIWLGENTEDLKIELKTDGCIDPVLKAKIERSNSLYHLEKVYQAHKEYVSELMLKKRIYDDGAYLKSLENLFEDFDSANFSHDNDDKVYNLIGTELNITHKQLELFLYGYIWEDGQDISRPLSKLTYDILKR